MGENERRGESVRASPGLSLSVLRFSSAVESFGEECIHRFGIGATGTMSQESALLTRQPFFPSSLLSLSSIRSFHSSPVRISKLFLFLRCVARASGPISSWTSHHSIMLSMPVRPCLQRTCTVDTRVGVRLISCTSFTSDCPRDRIWYSSRGVGTVDNVNISR